MSAARCWPARSHSPLAQCDRLDLATGVGRLSHYQLRGVDQVCDVVSAAQDVVVALLVAVDAPRPLDQFLRGGDERIGSTEVVAQGAEKVVNVGAGSGRAELSAPAHGAPPALAGSIG